MTDEELIARLRSKRQKGNRFDSLEYEAADRIEALTDKLEAARAERAKAVDRAIATLAEIKGESHD